MHHNIQKTFLSDRRGLHEREETADLQVVPPFLSGIVALEGAITVGPDRLPRPEIDAEAGCDSFSGSFAKGAIRRFPLWHFS